MIDCSSLWPRSSWTVRTHIQGNWPRHSHPTSPAGLLSFHRFNVSGKGVAEGPHCCLEDTCQLSDGFAGLSVIRSPSRNDRAGAGSGIRPHFYCLPIVKREPHRLALRKAATSGSTKFFLGTDSAPHDVGDKESRCGCAGIFNAPFALESYATVFDEEGALDHLEAFASANGPRFYGLPLNETFVALERCQNHVPQKIKLDGSDLVPFHAGEALPWSIIGRRR